MPPLLSIGELAERTGVAATALRYYDDLGLVRPAARASGRRRYAESAVMEVGTIVFLREIGLSLSEIRVLMRGGRRGGWRKVIERKLEELEAQARRIEVARVALEHGTRCPSGDPVRCPRFQTVIEGYIQGLSIEESHARIH